MANRDDVLERTCEAASDVLGVPVAGISPSSRFLEDLGAESIQSVELVACLEEEFEVELDEETALQVQTVGEAVDLIVEAMEEQHKG